MGMTLDGLRQAARRIPLPWQPGMSSVDIEANDAAWRAAYRKGLVKTPGPAVSKTLTHAPEVDAEPDDLDDERETSPLEDAKLRKELAQARNWELRNEALEGKLLPVLQVEATWLAFVGALDAALGALPEQLASRLDGDKREIKRVSREVINEFRDELDNKAMALAAEVEENTGPVSGLLERMDGASSAPTPAAAPTAPKKRGRPPKVKP